MLAFDLAEKNKKLAAIQYIKLLGLKNPENVLREGIYYSHINARGKKRLLLPCISFSEYEKKNKEYINTRMQKCLGYYVLEIIEWTTTYLYGSFRKEFWVELADTSFGKVILHGKNTNSIGYNEYYEVSSEINTDGDFAITFFKTYEKMKKWFDDWQGEGFYNYLVKLYEKQLNQWNGNFKEVLRRYLL